MNKLLIAFFIVWVAAGFAADRDDFFSRDRSIIAGFRCSSLKSVNDKIENLLRSINPDSDLDDPVRSVVGKLVYNEKLKSITDDNWFEALYFSQPQQKENDWVYVLHSLGEAKFTKAFQGDGTIRRELKEDGIIRFRQTAGELLAAFYVTFTGRDLILISRNRAAVEKARKLYAFSSPNGLLSSRVAKHDLKLYFHFNRFLLTNPRFLISLSENIRRDVLNDLAGSQAKPSNPLNMAMTSILESSTDLLREMAIIKLYADISPDKLDVSFETVTRYGGSLNYAVSNMPEQPLDLAGDLPAESETYSSGALWSEEYSSVLSGMALAFKEALGGKISDESAAEAGKVLSNLKAAQPQQWASALVDSPAGSKIYGPVFLAYIKFKNPDKLSAFYESLSQMLSAGEIFELMAEKGVKLEINNSETGYNISGLSVSRFDFTCRSLYFELPETLVKTQRYLSVLVGDTLVFAVPSAALDEQQFREAESFIYDLLKKAVASLEQTGSSLSAKSSYSDLKKSLKGKTMLFSSFNILRYLQLAVKSQKIWPEPTPPNSLPIPWHSYAKELMRYKATAKPVVIKLSHDAEKLTLDLSIPTVGLKELVAAILDQSSTRK